MNKKQHIPLILACILFALGLLGLALLGWQARYLQDDYCFDFLLKQDGFFTAQWRTYFEETAFNGNRYSTNIVMGLAALIGVPSARIMPLFILVTQLAGGYFLIKQINRWLSELLPCMMCLFLPLTVIFLTYTHTPNPFQSLFWRPASVTYSLPLAFLTFLGGIVLYYGVKPVFKPAYAIVIFLLALVTGGFAEHATVLEGSIIAVTLLFIIINKKKNPRIASLCKPLLAALTGAFVALLLMLLSPAARLRQQLMFPVPPALSKGLVIAFKALWDFILRALYRLPMHTLWTLLLATFLGLWLCEKRNYDGRHHLLRLSMTLFIGLALLFSLCLPGALATSAPPEERAQVLMSAVWVSMLIVLGFQLGRWLRASVPVAHAVLYGLAALALGLCLLVPAALPFSPAYPEIRVWLAANPALAFALPALAVLLAWLSQRTDSQPLARWTFLAAALMAALPGLLVVYTQLPAQQKQTALWDWRAEQINTAIASGQSELTLPALDSVAGVLELQENPDHWVNNCAELFYGLDVIEIEQPVLTSIPVGEID